MNDVETNDKEIIATERADFLKAMYLQLNSEMTRHLELAWQAVGVVVGSLAAMVLGTKGYIQIDIATLLIIIMFYWLVAHTIDSNYWYNRNLTIIANIERQFLTKEDLKSIHFYFATHLKDDKFLADLKIHVNFAFGTIIIALVNHLVFHINRIINNVKLGFDWNNGFSVVDIILFFTPYIGFAVTLYCLNKFKVRRIKDFKNFKRISPGIYVDDTDIEYEDTTGHQKETIAKD